MRLAFLLLGLALMPLRAEVVSASVQELTERLIAKLGADWTVRYNQELSSIIIKPVKRIRCFDLPIAGNPTFGPSTPAAVSGEDDFDLTIIIKPFVSPEKYSMYAADNKDTKERLDVLRADLASRGILYDGRSGESFAPKTEADRSDVIRYKQLQNSLHELPNFYFRNLSLSWGSRFDKFIATGKLSQTIVNEQEQQMCADMLRLVVSTFSTYPKS